MFSAFEFLFQGGWPMIPLAICSLAAGTIVIERLIALRRDKVLRPQVLQLLDSYEGEKSVSTLQGMCEESGGALSRVILELVHIRDHDSAHLIETANATGRREVAKLERGLVVLEIIAGASPLIGLLGTVLGMVTVFDAITLEGMGNPQVLSDGISKALVTTVAGLCVAIPSLAFHSYLSRHVELMATDMYDLATAFTGKLRTVPRRRSAAS